jgi:DNA (cytosine-5)-methyltransferase 1
MMNVGSLFSGIGGIELGFERAGNFRTAWFVENNPYCQAVLRKHWPGTPIYGDIKAVDWGSVEPIDILTGGFPCQDISIAGKKKGITGDRSGLWKEYLRAIRSLRPKYVVVENVARLLRSGIWVVLEDLAKEGYDAEWGVLRAQDFGAPHKRERCFVIAYPHQERRDDGFNIEQANEVCANPLWELEKNIQSGSERQRWLNEVSQADNGVLARSDFCGVDDGLPEGLDRIAACGNAVVPQVAEYIARLIKERIALTLGHESK